MIGQWNLKVVRVLEKKLQNKAAIQQRKKEVLHLNWNHE